MQSKQMRRFVFMAILLSACGTANAQHSRAMLSWQPRRLSNGSPILFQLGVKGDVESVSGECLGHSFAFFRGTHPGAWYALAGVPVQTPAGVYTLRITEKFANGHAAQVEKQIRTFTAVYKKIPIRVAKQFTEPSQTQLATISVDKDVKEKIFSEISRQRLWSGPFNAPVSEPVSDLFGTERVINGEVKSRHQGLDYAAPAGTPVRAVNRGVVILARPMFFEGNFIVIDHGQGLLSLYLHLSEFKVKEGDEVSGGQVIALSGGTGRATGAHLHVAIRWQGVYLDPALLLRLPIPAL
ncbi:MAG TPA: M23 family metallopeptidase [Terriglobales bacterium]|nr:M23 family metallopeptidase [Terriglobales bacterium]